MTGGYQSTGGYRSTGGYQSNGGYRSTGGFQSTGGFHSTGGCQSNGGYQSKEAGAVRGGYQSTPLEDWVPADVQGFIRGVAPDHPCADRFRYTSGYVLSTLTLEDLTRQCRDPIAAVAILEALKSLKQTPRSLVSPGAARVPANAYTLSETASATESYTVFVKTPAAVAVELEVRPTDTVAEIKDQLYHHEGTAVQEQRLVWNGTSLLDARTLSYYGVGHGASLLLVPRINQPPASGSQSARRGMQMTQGVRAWTPKEPSTPHIPVICASRLRHFTMRLDFDNNEDLRAFKLAARNGSTVLEVATRSRNEEPLWTCAEMEPGSEVVRLERIGESLVPNARRSVAVYLDGQNAASLKATLVTGGRIS